MNIDYVVLTDDYVTLEPDGMNEHSFSFEIPDSAITHDALLFFKAVADNVENLKFRVFVNGNEEQWAKYSAVSVATLHEVVGGLRAGTNEITFTIVEGRGTLRVGDAVILFKQGNTSGR
ncbi:hypothetical protein [Amycolatopsis sp. cmx-4-61]|uniref:hypothetical protein n=1 Tax=Amycolatopsis sp. cmx-4-61 TaxID=2790937 RepID=UPI00397CCB6D